MQPLIEYRLELAGVTTRALELEGEGPPILLFHGYADSADTWRLLLDRFARENRRALAVDLPGFGRADRLDREERILPQLRRFGAAAVRHLAEETGEDVVVSGNSLGGCLTLLLGEDPDLPLRALAPIAPAGFDHPTWFRVMEGDRLVRTLLTVPMPPIAFRAVVGEAYRQLAFARPRAQPTEIVAAFAQHLSTRRDVRRYMATGRRLLPELHGPFALHRVTAPLLLIWGDRDRMVTHKGARQLLDALPDTRYELLERVGHCPQIEAADRVADLLLAHAAQEGRGGRNGRATSDTSSAA